MLSLVLSVSHEINVWQKENYLGKKKRKIIWFQPSLFKCQRRQHLHLEKRKKKPKTRVLNPGCSSELLGKHWKNTDAWASPQTRNRSSRGGAQQWDFFLLFPRCLFCPAKVESLWPKEHLSMSKELKKPTSNH